MKIQNKFLLRKIKNQLPQLISAALIIAIGVGFFVTLKTVLYQYQKMSEIYYEEYSLADYTIYGVEIDVNDVEKVRQIDGIKAAEGRVMADYVSGDTTLRTFSVPIKEPLINKTYFYEGNHIKKDSECLLLKKYADVNELKIGDNIELKIQNEIHNFTITGLVATPEFVYLAQSESVPMADPLAFGVVYISENYFKDRLNIGYNQINVMLHREVDSAEVTKQIKESLKPKKVLYDLFKDQQISYKMYIEDHNQINSFAYIFPFIFFIIAAMIIYVLQKRNIVRERKQIGILKAMGLSNIKIVGIYTKYAIVVAVLGSLAGCLFSIVLGDYILDIFGEMFDIPELIFTVYLGLWVIGFIIALVVCVVSNFVGIKKVLKIKPAEAMNAEKPKKGKKILLENIKPLWNRLSFNTRYSLKTSLRNKGRFFAVVFGMAVSVALAVFALGFNDSFNYLINTHYNDFVKYDLMVNIKAVPLEREIEIIRLPGVQTYFKSTILPVKIEKENQKLDYPLLIMEDGFDMLNLKNEAGEKINLKDGIALPSYVANKLGVNKGDKVKLSSFGSYFDDIEVEVRDTTLQASSFYIYANYDFIEKEFEINNMLYNTIFIKTDKDVKELSQRINDGEEVISTTSKEQDKNTMLKILETMSFMIQILIIFAIMLGIIVLYAVGIINLTARSYEFIVLKVMGYGTIDIMIAYVKEIFFQIVIAVPFGFLLGNLILQGIKGEFSNDSFVLIPHIYNKSYLLATLLLVIISSIVLLLSIKTINRLDIVEGLKTRED